MDLIAQHVIAVKMEHATVVKVVLVQEKIVHVVKQEHALVVPDAIALAYQ